MESKNTVADLNVVARVPIRPHAGKVTDALSRIGYKLEEAIADLVDNSIDALATNVLVRLVHDGAEIKRIIIADDGSGMNNEQLLSAMQFGSERTREPHALGKFGMGLKTAALSQGRSLTVMSKKNRKVASCRWTAESIASGWNCDILDPKGAKAWLDEIYQPFTISNNGTLIVIDSLDHALAGSNSLETTLQKIQKKLSVHLGLVFHRFIDKGLKLYIDAFNANKELSGFSTPINSLNPFSYSVAGHKDYPLEFSIKSSSSSIIKCKAHIWPPNQTTQSFFLGGANTVSRQGFYFYRNSRLIQAGGWNGWRSTDSDHHLSLARVEVELPQELDAEFRLNVQKSALDVPEYFRSGLSSSQNPMALYVKKAEEIYRKKNNLEQDVIPVPGRGFAVSVQRKAAEYLSNAKSPKREVNITWGKLPEECFFKINRAAGNVTLNSLYRRDLLKGAASSINDAPVIKILLFLLLRDDLLRERESKRYIERLEEVNELLMLAVMEERLR